MITDDASPVLLSFGDLQLDRNRRCVTYNGAAVQIAPTEVRLLEVLMRWPGCVLESRELISHLWGDDVAHRVVPKKTPLRNCVFKLRSCLESAGCLNPIIENRSHVGYGLIRVEAPS